MAAKKLKERDLPFRCPNCGRPTDAPGRPCSDICRKQYETDGMPSLPVETKMFYSCMNPRCRVRHFPVEIGDVCPVCRSSGVYAGIAVKVKDDAVPQPDVEAE